jgi:hypothetical protein
LILREPALQLVSHYGQKLFAQLLDGRSGAFVFERAEPPDYARDFPVADEDIDHWALSTLRFIQFQELSDKMPFRPASIPAYTRGGLSGSSDFGSR